MTDRLTDAELDGIESWYGGDAPPISALVAEVREHRAAAERLNAIAEWAIDADHHPGCSGWVLDHGEPMYPCKCGRRDLFPERTDRG